MRKITRRFVLILSFLLVIYLGFVWIISHVAVADKEDFLYDSHNRRDPFVPLIGPGSAVQGGHPAVSLDAVKLEGVVVDPKHGSFVMIDGEIYEEGHFWGPYLIEKIEENKVVFKYNKEHYELHLEEE